MRHARKPVRIADVRADRDDLRAENNQLAVELAAARTEVARLKIEVMAARLGASLAKDEVARLRDYLRGIEWHGATSIDHECEWPACPECGGLREDSEYNSWREPVGHQPGCKMPGLISTSAPTTPSGKADPT